MKVDSPTSNRVRNRAYEIYLQRGERSGHELDDWLQAEKEIAESGNPQQERSHADFVVGSDGIAIKV